jgi:hypothetical protein
MDTLDHEDSQNTLSYDKDNDWKLKTKKKKDNGWKLYVSMCTGRFSGHNLSDWSDYKLFSLNKL